MPLSRDEERRVEKLLADAVEEGRKIGTGRALRKVIESRARSTLRADYQAAASIVERIDTSLTETLSRLADLFMTGSLERWRQRMAPTIEGVMEAATEPASEILGEFDTENPEMARFLDEYVSELAGRLSETTYEHVMDEVRDAQSEGRSVPDTAKAIRERGRVESPKRAKLIARNELQRTSKGASWKQASDSGVVKGKIRREQDDENTRASHRLLDGEERRIDDPYSNGEMYAGQTEINCRGWDEFVIDFDAMEAGDADPLSSAEEMGDDDDTGGDSGGGGGSSAGGQNGDGDADDLIREIFDDPNREVSTEEIERIVERVSSASFDPRPMRVSQRYRGLAYMEYTLGERADRLLGHLIERVVYDEQWADGTTSAQYLSDLRDAVRQPDARIGIGAELGSPPGVYVVAPNSIPVQRRGARTEALVFVLYGTDPGGIITGYQASALETIRRPKDFRWVQ